MTSSVADKISIVIPIHNEMENIGRVIEEIRALHPQAEIIVVDDGSTDDPDAEIRKCTGVISIKLPAWLGQSAAISEGIKHVTGDVCVIMDGDGQIDPTDIDRLVQALHTEQADAVFGRRNKMSESLKRRLASRIAYYARRIVLGDYIQDSCGPKAIKREHLMHLVSFDGMHRYMSTLLIHAGLRVIDIPVAHRPRRFGESKYTVTKRAFLGVRQIISVRRLLSKKSSPKNI